MPDKIWEVAIIGCGVVGAGAAYALARYDCDTLILEAENDVAAGTTKANSAILHAGYDPEPGTLMARLNVEGVAMAKEICAALDVPRRECGSLVVAFTPQELPRLQTLFQNGLQNGVPDLQLLDGDAARAMEPALSPEVIAALYAPTAAITSPWELALAMAETAVQNGAELHRDSRVCGIRWEETAQAWEIATEDGAAYQARRIINAAGLGGEAVHNMVAAPSFATKPSKGEYDLLDKSEGERVRHVLFQCPTAVGKGVLVAPTVHGNCIVGPTAEPGAADDTATTSAGLAMVASAAKKSVPGLDLGATIRSFAGVRAATDRDDFIIEFAAPHFLDLAGIKSPGLSAAPAIGKYAVELLRQDGLNVPPRKNFQNQRRKLRIKEMDAAQRNALIEKSPAYGQMICRCEGVTLGEIENCFQTPIPPRSVDGVKRRTNAGMGRCQGGFCGPRVVELLAQKLEISPAQVLQEFAGSNQLIGPTKQMKSQEGKG